MKTMLKRISAADVAFYLKHGVLPISGGAVINAYVDSVVASGKKGSSLDMVTGDMYIGITTFSTAAADDDGSIYRIFKDVNSNLVPVSLRLSCEAITGMTSVDCGLYDNLESGGAVVDKDCFAAAVSPAAGFSRILGLDLLVSVTLAEVRKRLWELVDSVTLTLNTKKPHYDICLTANTVGSGVGIITVIGIFTQG